MQRIEIVILIEQSQNVREAHRKAVVGENGARLCAQRLRAIQYALLAEHDVLDEVDRERRHDGEEVLQMQVIWISEFGSEHLHEHSELISNTRTKHAQSTHKARTKHAQSTHKARTKHAQSTHKARTKRAQCVRENAT
jgi:hypothetical protein